ncbi:VirB4-like conjugal transfer ATPase, CD1110 family, partial [Ruminococcus champanellensis]
MNGECRMKIQIFNRLIRHGESFRAPRSVQESIPVRKIYRDGVWLCGGRYSKMWRFQDVNYAVASEADQSEILMRYCSVINAWPDDAYVQVLTNNRRIDPVEFENTMLMHLRGDDMDRLREEYNQIVRERTEWSNNIFREKYIVISVQRRSIEEARNFFARVGTELASGFGRLSSQLTELSSHDRIRILHDFFRSGEEQYFNFDLSQAMARGQDFRDYIAPDSLQFKTDHFIMGKKFGRVLFLKDYPNFLKDETIARLCEFPQNLMLSIQIVPVPMEEAVADMQKRVLAVETDITRWQQKQNANHNFSAEPPYEMQQMRQEMKALLDDLTSRDQRMVLVLVTLVHLADSYAQLNSDTEAITATARGDLCRFNTLHFQQEEGLNTALPYGLREIEAMRTMNTESAAALTPFSVQDVMDRGGIYYGRNAISRNSIICNRKLLLNGNGFYLGVPGSGKSMAAKWELMNVILNTDDDVLICDPEAEFGPVVDAVRGQNIRLAPDSTQHVNALELGKGYEAGEKPVSLKSEFILTLYEHLLDVQTNGRRAKSIIDRAVLDLYEEFSKKPQAPTLQDLYRILQCQKEDLAKDIVLASEIFTKGSLNTFAQPTNVQLDNRVLCFNIRDLGQQLRPIGMLVLMEVVMMRVMQNRLRGKRTWIYFDELSVLFSYEWSTNFLDVSWKRYRKYGALASGIFQNLDQALDNEVARSMISNSEFLVLLNQAASDRTKLAELLHISDTQLSYVTDSEAGRGLLKMGG